MALRKFKPEVVEQTNPPSIHQVNPMVIEYMKYLRVLPVGTLVTYEQIMAIRPVPEEKMKDYLRSARNHLRRELQVWDAAIGIGIKRLGDSEIVSTYQTVRKRIQKTVRKATKVIMVADYQKLSREDKVRYTANLSALGALAVFSSAKSHERIADIAQTQKRIDVDGTISMFSKK